MYFFEEWKKTSQAKNNDNSDENFLMQCKNHKLLSGKYIQLYKLGNVASSRCIFLPGNDKSCNNKNLVKFYFRDLLYNQKCFKLLITCSLYI